MASAYSSIELAVPPEVVWQLVGGFGSLPDWNPAVTDSTLAEGGRTRRLPLPDGSAILERLLTFDEDQRRYTYTIVRASFPVTDYRSTLRVSNREGSKGSRVEWSGEFTPKGVSDQEASRIFQELYDGGLKALASHFSK